MATLIKLTAFLVVVTLSSSSIVKSPSATSDGNFELLILHNNDMHARFEQTSQLSGTCSPADRSAGKCYGGFPRVAHVVKEARAKAASGEGPPVLYLNAGDTYTGTAWFTIYKWKVAAEFVNALHPDAVSLGNNEIEHRSTEFSPFINNLNTPIVSSNVLFKDTNKQLETSVVFDIEGRKVAVVGYLKPESNMLDSTGNVEYIDEVLALKEEVAKLQAQNIDIIIALGHSDASKDLEIAREVEGVDVVIGGRKNTFYWNGMTVEDQIDEPIVVTQKNGAQVLVVQSYTYNKHLGKLSVKFDNDGNIVEHNTNSILLDNFIPQDDESLVLLNKYTKEIASKSTEVIGSTAVVLDGESCRTEECNLGNLITDAMMYYYATRWNGEDWTDAPIAMIPGGTIAASISPSNRPADITYGDVLAALPQESHLVVVTMDGTVLVQLLEHAADNYSLSNPTGHFLQYSGVRVTYDFDAEPGSRIVSAVVRCYQCNIPQFYVIDDWRTYKIIIPSTMLDARYGYNTILSGLQQEVLDYDEVTCLRDYINLRSPVYPGITDRVVRSSAAAITSSVFVIALALLSRVIS